VAYVGGEGLDGMRKIFKCFITNKLVKFVGEFREYFVNIIYLKLPEAFLTHNAPK